MKRLGLLCATGCVLLVSGLASGQETAPSPKVEVRGVQVAGAAYGDDINMQPLGYLNGGTKLVMLVTRPEGDIVMFDRFRSVLTTFVDDKGTDLAAVQEERRIFEDPFGTFPRVSEDGKACCIEVVSATLPAKGSASLSALGTISLRCASKKRTARQENVALKPGTRIKAGPVAFEIVKAGKSEDHLMPISPVVDLAAAAEKLQEHWEVTLRPDSDCASIAEIDFLDSAGKNLVDDGWFPTPSMEGVTVEQSFVFPSKIESATIAVTYWTDMKEVQVPFDVKATLGLE